MSTLSEAMRVVLRASSLGEALGARCPCGSGLRITLYLSDRPRGKGSLSARCLSCPPRVNSYHATLAPDFAPPFARDQVRGEAMSWTTGG